MTEERTMIKIILSAFLLAGSYLGIRFATSKTDKDQVKTKLSNELERSETLGVKSDYLKTKAKNDRLDTKLTEKEKSLEE